MYCSKCNGLGRIYKQSEITNTIGSSPCDMCDGTGEIKPYDDTQEIEALPDESELEALRDFAKEIVVRYEEKKADLERNGMISKFGILLWLPVELIEAMKVLLEKGKAE